MLQSSLIPRHLYGNQTRLQLTSHKSTVYYRGSHSVQ